MMAIGENFRQKFAADKTKWLRTTTEGICETERCRTWQNCSLMPQKAWERDTDLGRA